MAVLDNGQPQENEPREEVRVGSGGGRELSGQMILGGSSQHTAWRTGGLWMDTW